MISYNRGTFPQPHHRYINNCNGIMKQVRVDQYVDIVIVTNSSKHTN